MARASQSGGMAGEETPFAKEERQMRLVDLRVINVCGVALKRPDQSSSSG